MTPAGRWAFLTDRAAVLFIGVGVGVCIGMAFGGGVAAPSGRAVRAVAVAAPAARSAPIDCATPYPPRLAARIRAGQPVSIGVFGDSFGDGVWASLYRRLAKDNVRVIRLSQEGVGFTRYQSVDLERRTREQLRAEPVDLAVIIIGANDTQGLFDDDHKHAYPLMSPGWKAIYGARIDRLVGLIRDQGAMVYWLGLPKMRQPAYDRDIEALDGFVAARMAALGVPYLATRDLSADEAGAFNAYLRDSATRAPRLMRANDGVHMTAAGYDRIAAPLVERIRGYLSRVAGADRAGAAAPGPRPGLRPGLRS